MIDEEFAHNPQTSHPAANGCQYPHFYNSVQKASTQAFAWGIAFWLYWRWALQPGSSLKTF